MTEPEQYNEYGEIIKVVKPKIYERTLSSYDQHRIHETKDLFDSSCSYCQKKARVQRLKYKDNLTGL